MIGAILAIIKILGIIILSIIALVLLIILMVLFIPVRYRGEIYFKDAPDICLSVTWLLRFFSVNITYKDKPDITARIFWFFKVFSNNDKKKSKEKIATEKLDKVKAVRKKDTESKKDNSKIRDLEAQEKKYTKKKRISKDEERVKKDSEGRKRESKLDKALGKIKDIHFLLTDESNKEVLITVLEKLKNLLIHILPGKIAGFFKFGFDDPAATGRVLEGVAIFYPLYKDDFKIIPMFYDEIIEVNISFKGRIRIFYVAYILLILWLNKRKVRTRKV